MISLILMFLRVVLFALAVAAVNTDEYAIEAVDGLGVVIHNHKYSYNMISDVSTSSDHRMKFENDLETPDTALWTLMLDPQSSTNDKWIIRNAKTKNRIMCHENAGLYSVPGDVHSNQIWKLVPEDMGDGMFWYHIEVAEGEQKGWRIAMDGEEKGGCIPPDDYCVNKGGDGCAHMNVGDGDCDDHDHCFGNLICGTSNCADFPQQAGQDTPQAAEWDCCMEPDKSNPVLSTVWRFTDAFSSAGAYHTVYKITNRGACTIDLKITEKFGYSKSYETSITNTLTMGYEVKESASLAIGKSKMSEEMTANLENQLTTSVDEAMNMHYEIEYEVSYKIEPHQCQELKQFRVRSEEEVTIPGSKTAVSFYSKEFDWDYCEASGDMHEDDDESNCPPNSIEIDVDGKINGAGDYGGLDVEGINGISSSSTTALRNQQARAAEEPSRAVVFALAALGFGATLYGAAMHYFKKEAAHAYSEC